MGHVKRSGLVGLVLALVVGCVAGCGGQKEGATASAQAVVTLPQALSASDVVRVELTVSGEGITTRTDALVKSGAQWIGILDRIPAGEGRTFQGQAFDSTGTLRYAGQVTGIRIMAEQTTAVALVLQET
jgi:hypothetical protein